MLQEKLKYEQPTSVFEQFIIAGIHPDIDLAYVEETFAKRKKWETDMRRSGMIDLKMLQNHGPPLPIFEPQVKFPRCNPHPPIKRKGKSETILAMTLNHAKMGAAEGQP